jgi:hypothetical protein
MSLASKTATLRGPRTFGSSHPERQPATEGVDFDCCPGPSGPADASRQVNNRCEAAGLMAWRGSPRPKANQNATTKGILREAGDQAGGIM